jgi:5S rRNA maturation endonuclease (ribonuclease M5)
LSTHLKEKQEKIQQVLTQLAEESAKGVPIVVEGKKDVEALRDFGVTGLVLTVKTGGKSYVQAMLEIEQTGASEIVLLLDFDRRGKQGTSRLKESLERAHIKPNLGFWVALSALVGREIQCIEGLASYMRRLEEKTM